MVVVLVEVGEAAVVMVRTSQPGGHDYDHTKEGEETKSSRDQKKLLGEEVNEE